MKNQEKVERRKILFNWSAKTGYQMGKIKRNREKIRETRKFSNLISGQNQEKLGKIKRNRENSKEIGIKFKIN